jgi:cytochrome b
MQKQFRLIWDLPLRLFHWLLVLGILGSWYTSEQQGEMVELHMKLGYFILGLIVFRLVWGFVGTRHSKFSQFFPTPSRFRNYLRSLNDSTKANYPGHNPLGSLMVFVMIILILAQALSGLFINDEIFSSGPYYGTLSADMEKVMKFIHHNAFDLLLVAIAVHITAALYYRFIKKHDLITPMITGKKPVEDVDAKDEIQHSKIILAILLAALVAGFIYWLVVINAPIEEAFFY